MVSYRALVLRLGIAAVVLVGFSGLHGPSPVTPFVPPPAAPGGADDPEGRDRFEWMRLQDPATGRIPDNIREKELAFARAMNTSADLAPAGATPLIAPHAWTQR